MQADEPSDHERLVTRLANGSDPRLRARLARRGLVLVDAAEEAARHGGEDGRVTLQVHYRDGRGLERTAVLPVVRRDERTDEEVTMPASRVLVPAGNHRRGGMLRRVGVLEAAGEATPRDDRSILRVQSTLLPVMRGAKAEFEPVVYRGPAARAALMVVASCAEGSGVSSIEADADERGHAVLFDDGGTRAPFWAERRFDVLARVMAAGGPAPRAPLLPEEAGGSMSIAQVPAERLRGPIHVTVQHYQLVSSGVPSEPELDAIAAAIARIHEQVQRTGMLVIGSAEPQPQ